MSATQQTLNVPTTAQAARMRGILWRVLFSGQTYLWISWLVLLAIYLTTVYVQHAYASAIAVLILLLVLYYAEGMEIAVATLADKQEEVIDSPRAKRALQLIKRDTEWFFAQRQVFVVTIVTFMGLMTKFDKGIDVPFYQAPFYRELAGQGMFQTFFALTFTSFTILWWCQVFPKRLALRNSVIFLHQSARLMLPIRGIGVLNLPGPSDQLVWLATRFTSFSQLGSLKPSRAYFYETAAMLYGFALDRTLIRVEIRTDGSAIITQRMLLLFIHGGRSSATGGISTASPFLTLPDIRIESIYVCPLPERLGLLSPQLDQIFDGHVPGPGHTHFVSHDPQTTLNSQLTFEPTAPGPNEKKVDWKMEWGMPLPAGLRQEGQGRILVALMYEARVGFAPGAYNTERDYQIWAGELPCRKFSLRVRPEGQTKLAFRLTGCTAEVGRRHLAPFPDETKRITDLIHDKGVVSGDLDLDYPMQGTAYRIDWDSWQTV